MKESKLEFENEKSMYAICLFILAISLLSLMLLEERTGSFTGAAVYSHDNTKEIPKINYENLPLENATPQIAFDALIQADNDMLEMKEQGFGIRWVNDTLIEAQKYFSGKNYTALLIEIEKINDTEKKAQARELLLLAQEKIGILVDYRKVLEKTKSISERKKKAYEIKDSIRAYELKEKELKSQNLKTGEIESLISQAKSEFGNERYENAQSLLLDIDKKMLESSAQATIVKAIYKAGKDDITLFFRMHYREILMLLGFLSAVLMLLYNRIMISILRRKITDLRIEQEVLSDLMKKAQDDYFIKGDLTRRAFDIKTVEYKAAMAKSRQRLPVMQALLEKRLKSRRVL